MSDGLDARRAFARLFFGNGNRLKWGAFESGSMNRTTLESLRPFMADLLNPECRRWLLPCVRERDGTVCWYAIAADVRDARALREELVAAVGVSFSTFHGQPLEAIEGDPVDDVVNMTAPNRAFRLDLPNADLVDDVRKALGRLRNQWKARPVRTTRASRTRGRVLRDFEFAVLRQDRSAGRSFLGELERANYVSVANRRFLEARLLGGTGQWNELLAPGRLDDLLARRRPRRISELLIVGLYRTHIAPLERQNDPERASEAFRDKLAQKYRALFVSRAGMRAPEVAATFMLLASMVPQRPTTRDAILSETPLDAVCRPWLERLAGLVPAPHPVVIAVEIPSADKARAAVMEGDIDLALSLLWTAPPDLHVLRELLLLVAHVETLEAAKRTLDSFERATKEVQEEVRGTPLFSRALHDLETKTAGPAFVSPTGWLEWALALANDSFVEHAHRYAELGVGEWDTSAFLADSTAARALSVALMDGDLSEGASEILRECVPKLLEAFPRPEGATAQLAPVYEALLLIIQLDDRRTTGDLHVMLDLVRALVNCGRKPREYDELLEELGHAWLLIGRPSETFDWALDAVDQLASLPRPSVPALSRLLSQVGAALEQAPARVSMAQSIAYESLCSELPDSPEPSAALLQRGALEERSTTSLAELVERRTIAIYSITERLTQATHSYLKRLCPRARIDTFTDKAGGSPALKSAARRADIFIIFTTNATHAATGTIDRLRPVGSLTLRPTRTGRQAVRSQLVELLAGA